MSLYSHSHPSLRGGRPHSHAECLLETEEVPRNIHATQTSVLIYRKVQRRLRVNEVPSGKKTMRSVNEDK